ncbi:SET domain [Fusarium oxysporum f. sp. vasinfectum]|nr:SET domain [Fusarium oxysporum f. sp. vasinfectum]
MPSKKEPFVCGICGLKANYTKQHRKRHIQTHTGATHPSVSGSTNVSHSERYLAQEESRKAWVAAFCESPAGLGELIRQVVRLKGSGPARFRHTGGRFDSGPMADKMIEGMPNIFNQEGRIRDHLRWMLDFVSDKPSTRQAPQSIITPTVVAKLPCSHPNPRWPSEVSSVDMSDGADGNLWGPSLVWPQERQCDRCEKPDICSCISSAVYKYETPKIVPAGPMGEGTAAQRQYQRNQLLRELTGESVPLGQYEDGWAADLCRYNGAGELVRWCSVYSRIYGNWARKINHSCNFNVQFVSMRVSRKWRVMIQAVRNIAPGEPVTVDYGAEYWEGTAFSCMCGSARCIYGNEKEEDI